MHLDLRLITANDTNKTSLCYECIYEFLSVPKKMTFTRSLCHTGFDDISLINC